jgi:hypothetical protein
MISSEKWFPLFRIMLERIVYKAGRFVDRSIRLDA